MRSREVKTNLDVGILPRERASRTISVAIVGVTFAWSDMIPNQDPKCG